MAHACPQLRALRVAGCRGVGDALIIMLVVRCEWLEELDVADCGWVTAWTRKHAERQFHPYPFPAPLFPGPRSHNPTMPSII